MKLGEISGRHSMKRITAFGAVPFVLALLCVQVARAGDVIDRIVATVNGRIILESDWDDALCYEALLNGRSLSQFTSDDRRAVLDRLIDQELLREQMKAADFQHASAADAAGQVAAARAQYPQAASAAGWQSLLRQYHLTEQELAAHLQQQMDLTRLVDAHLRPAVQIDSKTVESYYRDKFVPQLRQSGAKEVPLSDVFSKIREVLTQEKVSELLVSWLRTLRSEGEVRLPGAPSSPGASSSLEQGDQSR
jgi:peptidyl-prolyl cis-trans isomerase SurA